MFNNTYTATPVSHHIDGYKALNGRILLNDEFTFVLEEVSYNGETIENPTSLTTKNFADGSFPFPAITYTNSGTYVYRVYEQTPDNTLAHAITYDTTNYYVTIVVKDNGTGNLYVDSETYTLTDASPVNTLSFLNKYTRLKLLHSSQAIKNSPEKFSVATTSTLNFIIPMQIGLKAKNLKPYKTHQTEHLSLVRLTLPTMKISITS